VFNRPQGITVLGSSGEVVIADKDNHRVQIFDSEGKYKQHFGTEGKEADGELYRPTGIASDVHGNLLVADLTSWLQVFSTSAPTATSDCMAIRERALHGVQTVRLQ
jgi:DNA-binding beta-propeller fold protein YncE